ncbi:hypothetical protein ACVIW0_004610 [Bradyrhizobium sp. USDA 4454]
MVPPVSRPLYRVKGLVSGVLQPAAQHNRATVLMVNHY